MLNLNCKHCNIDLKNKDPKCKNCGYPNSGTFEEKKYYVEKEIMNRDLFKDTVNSFKKSKKYYFL